MESPVKTIDCVELMGRIGDPGLMDVHLALHTDPAKPETYCRVQNADQALSGVAQSMAKLHSELKVQVGRNHQAVQNVFGTLETLLQHHSSLCAMCVSVLFETKTDHLVRSNQDILRKAHTELEEATRRQVANDTKALSIGLGGQEGLAREISRALQRSNARDRMIEDRLLAFQEELLALKKEDAGGGLLVRLAETLKDLFSFQAQSSQVAANLHQRENDLGATESEMEKVLLEVQPMIKDLVHNLIACMATTATCRDTQSTYSDSLGLYHRLYNLATDR